jgi:hypothetical protein
MVALTVTLSLAPRTSPFYEGVSPVSGATPYAGGELTRWRRRRGLKLNRVPPEPHRTPVVLSPAFEPWGIFHVIVHSALIGPIF